MRPVKASARQRSLRLLPVARPAPSPAPDLPDEQPFLRPSRRTRVRHTRRGPLGRAILALQLAGGGVVVLALLWGGYARVMASERLRVSRLEVRGGRFLSEGEVRELLGPAVGENILSLDLERLKARLQASPWVAEATVSRALPDTLRVEVRERVPLALAEVERLYLMDADGTLIDLFGPRTAGFDLPVVRGLADASVEARRAHGQRLATLLAELGELSTEVSELEVEPAGHIRVVLKGAGEVLRLDAPPYRPALQTFLALRAQLGQRCPDAEYFDLRFRDRIYVKRGTATPPSTAAPGPAAAPAVPARPPESGLAPAGSQARPATLLAQPAPAAVASRR